MARRSSPPDFEHLSERVSYVDGVLLPSRRPCCHARANATVTAEGLQSMPAVVAATVTTPMTTIAAAENITSMPAASQKAASMPAAAEETGKT